MVTRFSPFLIFPEGKTSPTVITYLGIVLPNAVIRLLVVYCLKDAVFTSYHGLPELIAIVFICVLHKWKKNTLWLLKRSCVTLHSCPQQKQEEIFLYYFRHDTQAGHHTRLALQQLRQEMEVIANEQATPLRNNHKGARGRP